MANIAERMLRLRNAAVSYGKVTGQILAWDTERVYCVSDRLNAFPRPEAFAAKPAFQWQVIALPQAFALAADCVVALCTRQSGREPARSFLELYESATAKIATAVPLDGTPVPLGLAIARRRALISLQDGRLVGVGEVKQ